MIFQAYKTIDAVNTSAGIHTIFVYVNELTGGLFSRLFLLSFFVILGIGAYLSQKRLAQTADLPASLAIAGFVTSGLAVMLSFIPGMITNTDLGVVIGATVLFVFWLFMTRRTESV